MLSLPTLIGGAPLYLTGEEVLRLTVLNANASIVVTLSGRFLPVPVTPDAPPPTIRPFTLTMAPAVNRQAAFVQIPLGEGWLLECSARVSSGITTIGQTYAIGSLVRGMASSSEDLSPLFAGYITNVQRQGWPMGGMLGCLEGAGALRTILGTSPGAGAEILETLPTRAHWELLTFRFRFVASGTVANRAIALNVDDGVNVFARTAYDVAIVAGATIDVFATQGFGKPWSDQAANAYIPLPANNRLPSAYRITTTTGNIQAGDQYSQVRYLVREWIEGN